MSLSVAEFVNRWKINALSERGGAQSHFIDLCDMLGEPHPAAADPTGERYTFEKPVSKVYGGYGFADVWLRDHFAWEYKRSDKKKHKDLRAAYKQLNDYREDLLNPPLLVVCDMNVFEVHTNFTSTSKRVYSFTLDDLNRNQVTATCPLPPLTVLRSLFGDTSALRPNRTDAFVTQEAAKVFARLAERLEIEKRSHTDTPIYTKEEIAHFLMRLLFCLFADSIELLPKHLFRTLIQSDDRFLPRKFLRKLKNLFQAMSEPDGIFGEHTIKYFNGGLFDTSSVIELDTTDLGILYEVSKNYNWAHVAPEIFGTLFERSLNKERRSLIGAHYTSKEDILLLIEPVLMQPLERRWAEVKANILAALEPAVGADTGPGGPSFPASSERVGSASAAEDGTPPKPNKATRVAPSLLRSNKRAEELLAAWIDELTAVRVLDPACGSGNFLYLALRRMLDLWFEAQKFAAEHNISMVLPKMVSPSQLYGIETEFYAHELASIVVWIGFLQWKHENGVIDDREPILQKLDNIQHADAIMRYDADGKPCEPEWQPTDYIVGNPPFLGDKMMRQQMGDEYVSDLRQLYKSRVPGGADLVTYWFEKARALVELGKAKRVGLLATQGIRGGTNRVVLERVKKSGKIFWAYADRDWVLNGAMVHVSMIAFDDGRESETTLDGERVVEISAALTGGVDLTKAVRLRENDGLAYIGDMKKGSFDVTEDEARRMLNAVGNPNGKLNGEVVKPFLNARDITMRSRRKWIIDFDEMDEAEAALFEAPFEYLRVHEKKHRDGVRNPLERSRWWQHGRVAREMRVAVSGLRRFIATPRHSKHRIFTWVDSHVIPDSALVVFAREDDYFFGVLHSQIHELWSRRTGTQVRDAESGFRYTPVVCFDQFPFPWAPGDESQDAPLLKPFRGLQVIW